MRQLSSEEVSAVSGGELEEVVVSAPRYSIWEHLKWESLTKQMERSWDEMADQWGRFWEFLEADTPPSEEALSEMSPEKLLKFWENLIGNLSAAQQAVLAAALLAAAKNAFMSPNMAADIHYAANIQGYGLKMDAAIKGVLDEVRFGK
jgi:hypothetical protein